MNDASKYIKCAYVATDGNDTTGDGTSEFPFATIKRALGDGASSILVKAGTYTEQIDLSYSLHHVITISNATPDGIVLFEPSGAVLANSESSVSGYTKVYSATISSGKITSDTQYIFQDGIPDESTEITSTERHPLQRGLEYRCEDTAIKRCSSATLADALDEIENADGYKWFVNGTTLYFSRPSAVNSTNPICYGDTNAVLFKSNGNNVRRYSVKMSGINTKYMGFNLDYMDSVEIADCKSSNSGYYGGFTFDLAINSKFIRCEAEHCSRGSNGDGFNGHGKNTGNTQAKETTTTMIDCWAHDNYDDGYSDHERCEMTVIGGLFEYNGKGGVTPSYGSHCTAYNVISRNNYNGFVIIGEPESAEGGIGTQLVCFNCMAMNHTKDINNNYGNGFIASNGNKMILVNCTSIGNRYGYQVTSGSSAEMYDCKAKDNTVSTKYGTGTFTIVNSDIVT